MIIFIALVHTSDPLIDILNNILSVVEKIDLLKDSIHEKSRLLAKFREDKQNQITLICSQRNNLIELILRNGCDSYLQHDGNQFYKRDICLHKTIAYAESDCLKESLECTNCIELVTAELDQNLQLALKHNKKGKIIYKNYQKSLTSLCFISKMIEKIDLEVIKLLDLLAINRSSYRSLKKKKNIIGQKYLKEIVN